MGKSRLVAEFVDRALDASPAPVVLRGRCLPYGEGLTYWPLAEILKSHAGVRDSEPPASALEKVRAAGRELIGPELAADPARAVAALAFTVGLDDPDHSMRDAEPRQVRVEVHAAWRAFFSALGSAGPTVVVIEDIHWADRAMLDLLQELADRTQGGVLFLCPSRPELTARRPDWGGGRRSFSSVVLEPLSEADADRLVDLLLAVDDLPVPVQRRIVERAEGNPFFLEEILRKLIDEGRIVRDGDRWRASGDIGDVEIPDTVQAVLAARIDLLEAEEKRALQAAAVVGRVFWPSPVARLIDGDGEGLEDVLARLEDRELVLGRLGSSLEGEREFIFKHVLTCDVAYESLPRRERARAHAEVAGWLETTAGERRHEFAELLAYHYLAAHREATAGGVPTDGDALRSGAFEYALLAAADARGKLALDSAGRLVEQALEIAATPLERSRAHEELGRIFTYRYEGDLAWEHLRKAADIRLAETERRPHGDRAAVRAGARPAHALAGLDARRGPRARGARLPRRRLREPRARRQRRARPAADRGRDVALRLPGRRRRRPLAGARGRACRGGRGRDRRRGCAARCSSPRRWTRSRPCGCRTATGATSSGSARGAWRWSTRSTTRGSWATSTPSRRGARSTRGATATRTSSPTRAGAASPGEFPSVHVHTQAWAVVASFRMGEWDRALLEFEVLRELLGDRRDEPPYFASRPYGWLALLHELRGEPATADRLIGVLDNLGTKPSFELAFTGSRIPVARVLARRGRGREARELLHYEPTHGHPSRGIALEVLCDVARRRVGLRGGRAPALLRLHARGAERAHRAARPRGPAQGRARARDRRRLRARSRPCRRRVTGSRASEPSGSRRPPSSCWAARWRRPGTSWALAPPGSARYPCTRGSVPCARRRPRGSCGPSRPRRRSRCRSCARRSRGRRARRPPPPRG